jgi:hypothetical protein
VVVGAARAGARVDVQKPDHDSPVWIRFAQVWP